MMSICSAGQTSAGDILSPSGHQGVPHSAHTLHTHHTEAHNLLQAVHIYIYVLSVCTIRHFTLQRNLSSIQRLTHIYGTSCTV